ncbi:MAG: OmpA family protein [Flavobacteriaceae bacterium]|nr:OmpA family protein [Flavobacteriaceae bacterium]
MMKINLLKYGNIAIFLGCFLFSSLIMAQQPTFKDKADKKLYQRVLEEANLMYKRLKYVDAAKKYEEAVSLSTANDPKVIGKLADCYYYNSEMKEAHKWYEKMYVEHKDNMSSAYLFKYMHALKGNNRYSKAKKIDAEYLEKIDEERAQKMEKKNNEALDSLIAARNNLIRIINIKTNTGLSEFGPMYYGDKIVYSANDKYGKKIYSWDGNPFLDLYVADIKDKKNGHLGEPKKFSDKVNTEYHEADVTFTNDGKTMYFTRNNHKKKERRGKDGINHLMILKTTLKDGAWSKPEILPFVTDEYSYGHPVLSKDNSKMYFVSNMPGSIGQTDIFVVDILANGSFSAPKNLGDKINTTKKEMFPYVVGDKLYFASDGHIGLGGLDLFESTLSTDGYSEPVNLQRPINSNMDDFAMIIKPKENNGYFSSNRIGGRGNDDIYFFRNKTQEELDAENQTVVVIDTIPESFAERETVKNKDSLEVINLNRILFPFDKATITAQAKTELTKVLAFMQSYPDAIIEIRSHTDSRGPVDYNQKLSQRRADSTKKYLISNGLDVTRIKGAVGYGESDLLNKCSDGVRCTREEHHINRRSEFVVIKKFKE